MQKTRAKMKVIENLHSTLERFGFNDSEEFKNKRRRKDPSGAVEAAHTI